MIVQKKIHVSMSLLDIKQAIIQFLETTNKIDKDSITCDDFEIDGLSAANPERMVCYISKELK